MAAKRQDVGAVKTFGGQVDFGRAASDYGRHRAGFPDAFFDRLVRQLALIPGQAALDVGTGTGTVARGLAARGLKVIGVDPSPDLMRQAAEIGRAQGVSVDYREGKAEALPVPDQAFDLITVGQCWHWFDRPRAAAEVYRALKPGGAVAIAHFDWLPLRGTVVAATEAMIIAANPAWAIMSGGDGLHPQWLADLSGAGFIGLETASFDIDQPYSPEAWRGRIRASAGIKASLDAAATARFDADLAAMLARDFPSDPLLIPHRVWWATGRRPIAS